MDKTIYRNRLSALHRLMADKGIDAYLIVSDDYHASEYVGEYFKCREFLSGFDGSAGSLVITQTEAGLWTDGRYFLQAREQLDGTGITLQKMGEPDVPAIPAYLAGVLQDGQCLGYDGRTIRAGYAAEIEAALAGKQIRYVQTEDLVGQIWKDRPAFPEHPVWILPDSYVGKSRAEKLAMVREHMAQAGAERYLLASLDDIAWLYNIRGNDIAYNPVVLSYTIIEQERAVLYAALSAFSEEVRKQLEADGIILRPYLQVYEDLKQLPVESSLMLDQATSNVALLSCIPEGVKVIKQTNPTTLFKAVKTPEEMENERKAHIQDGVAVTKIIYWLKQMQNSQEWKEGRITEQVVRKKLEALRQEREGYLDQSFAPIIAAGAHGAIVHYEPTEATDIPLVEHSFVLMDTGGQYWQGTTDITRTVSIGTLTDTQKAHYTAVLRGNLNLGAARFKHGCTGMHLDVLARTPLWELGLDYNHGTGHGVGYLLNVHEGPNAIRFKEAGGKAGAVLEEGMITSNEPGLYLEGQYGIRVENLVLCRKAEQTEYGQFMEFETLTMVPHDRAAILPEQMSKRELALLNAYHKTVYETISPYLTEEERKWLKEETREIG
ncbi:MAG: aminopeptidase P family protein [Lachnospiraceae bacterium]|nr:aminopeptidase P family protein [Lachnospiraceae bacterium]